MNPSFKKDTAAFRATAPTPTEAMRVMLGHKSRDTYVPTFLEVIPLVLGAPYSPPPFAYHSIEHAVDLPPRLQETISKLGFRRPPDIYAWLASLGGPHQLDTSMKRIAEAYLEDLLSNHRGTLRFVIEEINRLRVSAMRSPQPPTYTSSTRRLTSLLFHIDERDLRGALDGVCMVHDALLWVRIQYPWVVGRTGIDAAGWEREALRKRGGTMQEAIREIAEFADERCAHRLLRRMISDLL